MSNRRLSKSTIETTLSDSTTLLTGSPLNESKCLLKEQILVAEPYTCGIGHFWQRTRLCSVAFVEAVGAEIELPNMRTQKRPPRAMDDGYMFLDSRNKDKNGRRWPGNLEPRRQNQLHDYHMRK